MYGRQKNVSLFRTNAKKVLKKWPSNHEDIISGQIKKWKKDSQIKIWFCQNILKVGKYIRKCPGSNLNSKECYITTATKLKEVYDVSEMLNSKES